MIKALAQINKFEKYLLIFTLVDILFAPYVSFLATTYSQFIVFLWFVLKGKRYFNQREVNFYYACMGFILLSVFVSLLVLPYDKMAYYALENFKRGLNIGLAISYYFFFYYIFKVTKVEIEKWLMAFVLFVTLWGVLYYLNMGLFYSLKAIFNPRDATMSNLALTNFFMRFNYTWTDPNNLGYMLVGVVSFLIINKRVTNIQLIAVVICLLFNLLIIMSAGSIITAALFIPAAYFIRAYNSGKLINFATIVISIVVMVVIVQNYYSVFSNSEIGEISITRLVSKNEMGDSRPQIWKELLESKNILLYVFTGEGAVLFVNNQPFSPHNGHFVLIFGYGMICYFLYLFIVFRKSANQKWVDFLYILPFLICFTINIGIGELKYAAIMYMLVAFSRTQNREQIQQNQLRQIRDLRLSNQK